MPELPEVTTITNQLKKELTGKTVVSVFVNPGYNVYPSSEGVVENVSGAKVCDVFRVAKVIVIKIKKDLEEKYVAIHLAMTGRIKFLESKNVFQNISQDVSHLLVMNFDNKSQIVFTDQRRFGYVKLLSGVEFEELKNKYGPDSLEVNVTEFEKKVKSKNMNIKKALLDQELISGIGNIYANEALFISRIHPETKTRNLTTQQLNTLLIAIKQILKEGIKYKGSTLNDLMYTDIYGNYGEYQKHFKIYNKNRCLLCKTRIKFMSLNGRGTYFCPSCQKACL